jgi:hypothetical protein
MFRTANPPRAAHALGVAFHHGERCADLRREIDLILRQIASARFNAPSSMPALSHA